MNLMKSDLEYLLKIIQKKYPHDTKVDQYIIQEALDLKEKEVEEDNGFDDSEVDLY